MYSDIRELTNQRRKSQLERDKTELIVDDNHFTSDKPAGHQFHGLL